MIKDDFVGSIFGEEGQLTILGENGLKGNNKKYKIHCSICAKDTELFGDGCLYITKGNLVAGRLPCGCAKSIRWTEEQYKIRIKRKCKEYGDLEFLGFSGDFKGAQTKLKIQCNKHEEPYVYEGTNIHNLLSGQRGCRLCKNSIIRDIKLKPDQEIIDSFFSSGIFKEGTHFYRSERKSSQGRETYWHYTCPVCSNDEYVKAGVCSGVFESHAGSLQKGRLSCRCGNYHWTQEQREYQINKRIKEENLPYEFLGWIVSYKNAFSKFRYKCQEHMVQKMTVDNFLTNLQGCPQCAGHNQQECYINGVYNKETLVALKFGIANNSKKRVKQQNNKCVFDIKQLKVFTFPSVSACKVAEKVCKEELQCSILSKSEMPDGWTETTSPLNLEKIIDNYKRHGGIDKQ